MDYMEKVITLMSKATHNDMNSITQLSQESKSIFRYNMFPFEMKIVSLPQYNTGYCYMLMSSKNRRLTYIGQTGHLRDRLNNHNQGAGGTNMTNEIQNRPWSLLAYIVGFDNNRCHMQSVQASWQKLINQAVLSGIIEPLMLAQKASQIVENNSELTLVFHF
jgi:predicted GIY-YIG superfamily endonuclease